MKCTVLLHFLNLKYRSLNGSRIFSWVSRSRDDFIHEICEWEKEEKDHRNTEGRLRMSNLFEHITKTPFQNHFLKHHKYCPNLCLLPQWCRGPLTLSHTPKIIFRFGISINIGLGLGPLVFALGLDMLRYYSIIITDQFGIKHRANKGPWCWTLLPLAPHSLSL